MLCVENEFPFEVLLAEGDCLAVAMTEEEVPSSELLSTIAGARKSSGDALDWQGQGEDIVKQLPAREGEKLFIVVHKVPRLEACGLEAIPIEQWGGYSLVLRTTTLMYESGEVDCILEESDQLSRSAEWTKLKPWCGQTALLLREVAGGCGDSSRPGRRLRCSQGLESEDPRDCRVEGGTSKPGSGLRRSPPLDEGLPPPTALDLENDPTVEYDPVESRFAGEVRYLRMYDPLPGEQTPQSKAEGLIGEVCLVCETAEPVTPCACCAIPAYVCGACCLLRHTEGRYQIQDRMPFWLNGASSKTAMRGDQCVSVGAYENTSGDRDFQRRGGRATHCDQGDNLADLSELPPEVIACLAEARGSGQRAGGDSLWAPGCAATQGLQGSSELLERVMWAEEEPPQPSPLFGKLR